MTRLMKERWAVQADEHLIAFLIGTLIIQWQMMHRCRSLLWTMTRMRCDLTLRLVLGFLGGGTWFRRTIILVQYWRSSEQLAVYAHAKNQRYALAWAGFNFRIGNHGTVGVKRQACRIAPDHLENIFVDTQPTGMGGYAALLAAKGQFATASERMELGQHRAERNDQARRPAIALSALGSFQDHPTANPWARSIQIRRGTL